MSKNIVVVGASSGIGAATAELLKEQGNHITALGRTQAEFCDDYIQCDVTKVLPDMSQLSDEVHGLVYCPGTINLKPFSRIKTEDFLQEMQINFLGAVSIIQSLQNKLKNAKGSIVLFSTVAVQTGMPFHSSIAAAKGAVEGLTRSLAAEFAPHIRVNAIAPSLTDTPLAERLLNSDDKKESAAKRHPLNRVGEPKEIANLISFLLSENAGFITGQILKVDGGMGALKI